MQLIALAILAALVPQTLSSPLSNLQLADIPEYNVSRRHDPKHHEEIGIPGRDLLNHLHENYSHRKFIKKREKIPYNMTKVVYDIPDDLMDLAIRSYPLHKRHENVLKRRSLQKRVIEEPAFIGPLKAQHAKPLFIAVVRFLCAEFNDYLRDMMVSGGPSTPNYMTCGPVNGPDGQQGDAILSHYRDKTFPPGNEYMTCTSLMELSNCAGGGNANGGQIGEISRTGDGKSIFDLGVGVQSVMNPVYSTG
ncbi:hypothetical protein TWF281_000575 [Arthrobotrys megalospora]